MENWRKENWRKSQCLYNRRFSDWFAQFPNNTPKLQLWSYIYKVFSQLKEKLKRKAMWSEYNVSEVKVSFNLPRALLVSSGYFRFLPASLAFVFFLFLFWFLSRADWAAADSSYDIKSQLKPDTNILLPVRCKFTNKKCLSPDPNASWFWTILRRRASAIRHSHPRCQILFQNPSKFHKLSLHLTFQ